MRFCPRCGNRYENELFCPDDGVKTDPLPEAGPGAQSLLGSVVDGRYRVEKQIGEGGMGVVYRATHVALNKPLALKVLRGEMAKDQEVVARFIQEAQAATSIGHENIIDISDFGKLPDGTVYFVMEYLNGIPLNDMIKRGGSIPVSDAVEIVRQIASALGAAHAQGIVHRDLKPDNVYVIGRGEDIKNFVKVLDFGIAKVGGASNKLTRTGMVFGTPHYMSPEQAAGQSVDNRTDIYALGVIMYEMFTGHVPFDADTFMGVLTKHMFEKPGPMNQPGDEKRLGALEDITMKALEKKPENRYQTMAELIEDLDRVLGGGKPQVRASQPQPSAALADALEPRSRSEMRLDERLSRVPELPVNHTGKWLGIGGSVLVVAIVLAFVFLRGGSGSDVSNAKAAPALPAPAEVPALPAPVVAAPTPAPAPDAPAAGAQPQPEVILVESVPSGATVVMEGAIVGKTPARFPRPTSGGRTVELILDGYSKELVRISPVSPEQVSVNMRKKSTSAAPQPAKAASPQPAQPAGRPRRRASMNNEVVDPWAN